MCELVQFTRDRSAQLSLVLLKKLIKAGMAGLLIFRVIKLFSQANNYGPHSLLHKVTCLTEHVFSVSFKK